MEIVLATDSLAAPGGVETYTTTVADHLQRLGHDVWLRTMQDGRAGDHARALGLRVVTSADGLPPSPGAIVVQDATMAYEMAAEFPLVPQVFVAHSERFDVAQPPGVQGVVAVVVTLYDRVLRRVRARNLPYAVVALSQPIDIGRFVPTSPPRTRAISALTLGNYVHGDRLAVLRRACQRASIELVHIGGHAGVLTDDPREAFNRADIVFGKARVILEAMACGRPAYVFDHNGGEGWVTAGNAAILGADNFGGQSRPIAIDEQRLVADLQRYDPTMGLANRDYVVANHSAHEHAVALVGVLREVAPRAGPVDAPLRELARLSRSHHRADVEAFLLTAELERTQRRIDDLHVELEAAHAALYEANTGRHDANLALHETNVALHETSLALNEANIAGHDARVAAHQAGRALAADRERIAAAEQAVVAARQARDEVVATRRWRTVQRVLAPIDRLRGRR